MAPSSKRGRGTAVKKSNKKKLVQSTQDDMVVYVGESDSCSAVEDKNSAESVPTKGWLTAINEEESAQSRSESSSSVLNARNEVEPLIQVSLSTKKKKRKSTAGTVSIELRMSALENSQKQILSLVSSIAQKISDKPGAKEIRQGSNAEDNSPKSPKKTPESTSASSPAVISSSRDYRYFFFHIIL